MMLLGLQKCCLSLKSAIPKMSSSAFQVSKIEANNVAIRSVSFLTGANRSVSCLTSNHTIFSASSNETYRTILKTSLIKQTRKITKLTSFNVVDNSKLGQKTRRYKKPYLIGFYRKRKTADIGDIIKVAVQGRPCKALVVATRKPKSQSIPRFDNNNIVLLDDNLAPLGTRIKGPIPAILRKKRDKFSKLIALASRFV